MSKHFQFYNRSSIGGVRGGGEGGEAFNSIIDLRLLLQGSDAERIRSPFNSIIDLQKTTVITLKIKQKDLAFNSIIDLLCLQLLARGRNFVYFQFYNRSSW